MVHSVLVQPSGHQFEVEDGERVLDAALRQGIALPYGCRNGRCGSCKGTVVRGEIHYDGALPGGITEAEAALGQALFCQALARTDLEIEVRENEDTGAIPIRTLPCRVHSIDMLAHDVVRMRLKLPDTERLQFLAGQYINLLLANGERRAFSLANAPHDDALLELHIRHIDGGLFTDRVFAGMKEKTLLRFEGPHGSFYLREKSDRPMIFMAGGTGFAPIKGIIEHALAEGVERPMHLYWGARARRDLYLHDLAQSWAERYPFVHYVPVLSEPMDSDHWQGRTGFVHEAIAADFDDLGAFDVYAGGPPVMVHAGKDVFVDKGMDLEHFYSDAFEYSYATESNA